MPPCCVPSDLETKRSGAARTRSVSSERLRSPVEQIVQADAQDFDTSVCRDIGCRSKGNPFDRPIEVERVGYAAELQMEVFDPKRPIRKEAPLKSTPGRPTVGRCRRRGAIDRERIRRFGTLGTVASLGNRRGLVRPGKPAAPIHEQIVEDVADASAACRRWSRSRSPRWRSSNCKRKPTLGCLTNQYRLRRPPPSEAQSHS
jgi:hypothetical protein